MIRGNTMILYLHGFRFTPRRRSRRAPGEHGPARPGRNASGARSNAGVAARLIARQRRSRASAPPASSPPWSADSLGGYAAWLAERHDLRGADQSGRGRALSLEAYVGVRTTSTPAAFRVLRSHIDELRAIRCRRSPGRALLAAGGDRRRGARLPPCGGQIRRCPPDRARAATMASRAGTTTSDEGDRLRGWAIPTPQ